MTSIPTPHAKRMAWQPPTLVAGLAGAALVAACGGGGGGAEDFSVASVDSALALPAATAAAFTEPAATASEYQRHLDTATANAGTEFAGEQRKQWCYSVENAGAPPDLADRSIVPMTKLFDNFYFGGTRSVGQYVLKTATGFFMLDALNNSAEARDFTVPGLQTMGFNPFDIKGILPTHGHGDHYGGAKYMQATYGSPVYIGSADAAALQDPAGRNATSFAPLVGGITTTPIATETLTPQTIAVDGVTLTVLSTPGHTVGTFSGIMPVTEGGKNYKLIFWGGTGTPTTLPLTKQYLDGSERLYQLAKSANVDGTIHTHAFVDGSLKKVDAIRAGTTGGKNPFILGNASTLRSLSILRECSAAKVNSLDATIVNPVWLTTTTQAVASAQLSPLGGNSNVSAKVRVNDPYGPVANVPVTLSLSGGTESCTATTDSTGVAACGFLTKVATSGRVVTAAFQGSTSATKVRLTSAADVTLK
jgi:glyoxylase-like metal-dependent hydrolase (beta-lactamase superfamily II)